MSKKQDLQVTGPGIASYVRLNKPDTKFNADGTYGLTVLFEKDVAKDIVKVVKGMINQGERNPVKPELDDNGDKTGKYSVSFKMNAVIRSKKSEESFVQKPVVVDSMGTRLSDNIMIGGGSEVQVSFTAHHYDNNGGGVNFRLKAVRILDLVEYVPEGCDWGDVEGTYKTESVISETNEIIEEGGLLTDVDIKEEDGKSEAVRTLDEDEDDDF